MITKRIIPCLDVRSGRVVKGTNFEGIRDVADPVEMARLYNAAGADELVFYDITASFEGRALFTDILTRVASEIFIPLTVGGGINTLEDFDRVLKCGADKVSVNSGALKDPGLIPAAAQRYGDQCVVLSACDTVDLCQLSEHLYCLHKSTSFPVLHRPLRQTVFSSYLLFYHTFSFFSLIFVNRAEIQRTSFLLWIQKISTAF